MSKEAAMACNESRRVQAYLDGEPVDADAVEQHIDGCSECTTLRDELLTLRTSMRTQLPYHRADARLRGRLVAALDREEPRPSPFAFFTRAFWAGTAGGAFATACAALLAFFLVVPPQANLLTDDILSDHLRSLMPGHLIDVASSNHHTVKPWFAGRADVSPPVANFAQEGYELVGGRADMVDGRRAAVTIYRHGAHVINVFAWPADDRSLPGMVNRNGYHFVYWKSGNIAFCAVSDTALDELLGLVRMLKAMGMPDSGE
jgi:anti-sigma factor RsiW